MKSLRRVTGIFLSLLALFLGFSTIVKRCDYGFIFVTRNADDWTLEKRIMQDFNLRFGYWKDIHKAYYLLSSISYRMGDKDGAIRYLHKSLHYHPYYPNAFKALAFLHGVGTNSGRACYRAYEEIMKAGKAPEKSMVDMCLSEGVR